MSRAPFKELIILTKDYILAHCGWLKLCYYIKL